MKLFISYRRKTWPFTQRLASDLERVVDAEIFVDVAGVDNVDFERSILTHLRNSDAVLLVISPETFSPERIQRDDDWVRHEIALALELNKPIVLVCVDGLLPPSPETLPENIRNITRMQGINFYPEYWDAAMLRLADFITKAVAVKRRPLVGKPARTSGLSIWMGILGLVVLVLVLIVVIPKLLNNATLTATPTVDLSTPTPTATPLPPSTTPATSGGLPPEQLAKLEVTRNADWQPYQRDFDGVPMMLVPVGCFVMGNMQSTDQYESQIDNRQCIDSPFWIDKTEVTQAQFKQVGGTAQKTSYYLGADRPVEQITWFEAQAFCQKRGARLPSEAEWEYAARGPDDLLFPWGNNWNPRSVAWNSSDNTGTASVGSTTAGASWIGAVDLAGNVWEWTSSLYKPYPYDRNDGREDRAAVSYRVLRGGAWRTSDYLMLQMSVRGLHAPEYQGNTAGFRCAHSI